MCRPKALVERRHQLHPPVETVFVGREVQVQGRCGRGRRRACRQNRLALLEVELVFGWGQGLRECLVGPVLFLLYAALLPIDLEDGLRGRVADVVFLGCLFSMFPSLTCLMVSSLLSTFCRKPNLCSSFVMLYDRDVFRDV